MNPHDHRDAPMTQSPLPNHALIILPPILPLWNLWTFMEFQINQNTVVLSSLTGFYMLILCNGITLREERGFP